MPVEPPPFRVALTTLGCKLNQYESNELQSLLEGEGFRAVPFDEPAHLYVINTCTVTAGADYSDRQMIRRAIARNPEAVVVVTGCYAQTNPEAVSEIPGVDYILGNQEKYRVLELVTSLKKRARPLTAVGEIAEAKTIPILSVKKFAGLTRAFIKIQDGCQHRCAFCIVPYARGGSRSQHPEVVLRLCDALRSRLLVPLSCLRIILRHALSLGIQHPEVELCTRVPLGSGLLEPLPRLNIVLRHTTPLCRQHSEVELRLRIALDCLCMQRSQVCC